MRLPFQDGVFGAVAAVYVLYFFERPVEVLTEIRWVLRPDGLFASVTISRDDIPELTPLLEPEVIESFDAENGPPRRRRYSATSRSTAGTCRRSGSNRLRVCANT